MVTSSAERAETAAGDATVAPPAPLARDARLRGHVRALDGIRGLAILMVLALHFIGNMQPTNAFERVVVHVFDYGSLGVDLFFVLSGFLITGILFEAKGTESYFRNFYMRRALRIFPLYYAVLAFIFFVAPLVPWLRGEALDTLRARQAWAWLYGVNVYDAIHASFSFPYIDHFWSLAVEEHFYFFWPLVVWAFPRGTLMRVSALIALASLVLRVVCAGLGVSELALFVLTPCRLDALCVGGFLALAARGPDGLDDLVRRIRRLAPFALGLLVGLYAVNRVTLAMTKPLHQVRNSLFAVVFGCMIVLSVTAPVSSLYARFFRSRAMVWLGQYSYGLYVFHHFISAYFTRHETEFVVARWVGSHTLAVLLQAVVGLLLSVGVAVVSFRLFESRFLAMKRSFAARGVPAH
jgi:peptidoglycan/LPS O-acetylase OafA/YrhL